MAVPTSPTAVRYGEFVQSIYDTINTYDGEYWCFPLYGKSSLFSMASLTKSGSSSPTDDAGIGNAYNITRYIYCTVQGFSSILETGTPWIGYIAESTKDETQRLGRRDIVVAIRGTIGSAEWIKNFTFNKSDLPFLQPPVDGAQVHTGFLSIYMSSDPTCNFGKESMKEQICNELQKLLSVSDGNSTSPVRITITGHSLGGALATLAACDVGCNIAPKFSDVKVSAITFGSPRVGNDKFKGIIEENTDFILRYRNISDPVPKVPPEMFWGYKHVGTELILDWKQSPFVSINNWYTPFKCHNLELYMHVMAAEGGGAVYTSTQLEAVLANYSITPSDRTYIIQDISRMPAWGDQNRDALTDELEIVKDRLKQDPPAMVAYLCEVNYIAAVTGDISMGIPRQLHATDEETAFRTRDYSLLNKSDSILKEEYHIPEKWLVHPNKDMVRDSVTHEWLPRKARPSDIPSPDNPEYN